MHDGKLMNTFTRLFLLIAVSSSLCAQNTPSQQKDVQATVENFINAFDNLDWQAFRTCFSTTATIFHPAAPNINLIDSPDQFEKAWLGVFERIKKNSGRTSPPYMKLSPLDLRVEKLSADVALVTFHLVDGSTVNRRTLVFKRDPDGWKIVHIHASNITAP